jgi:hypothetical protein
MEDIKKLKAPRTHKFDCSPTVILAPFQAKAILQADTKDPLELIPIEMKAAKEHDESKEHLDDSAVQHNKFLTLFFWGVYQKKIDEGRLVVDNDDNELRAFLKRHADCILPSIPAGAPTFQSNASYSTINQLTAVISSMNKNNEQANALCALEFQRAKENDEKKTNRAKKWLDENNMRMLLNAGSKDGEQPPKELTDDFIAIFNSESVGAAGKMLLTKLRGLGSKQVFICEGALSSIYHGDIVSSIHGEVGQMSVFSFKKSIPLQKNNQSDHFTIIHLMNQFGKPMSQDEIKASLKQSVVAPTSYHEMYEMAEIFGHVLTIMIGRDSKPTVYWNNFTKELKDCQCQIESMTIDDKNMPTKILYLADVQMQQFLSDAMFCEDKEDVDNTLLDFRPLTRSIRLKTLNISLPAQFKTVNGENKENEVADELSRSGGGPAEEESVEREREEIVRKVIGKS